jgi:hypothetical protein
LTPGRANRRFVAAATCAFAAFFVVDWYLFAQEGFLRAFGPGTQEGQVLSKVRRAGTLAATADVIFFGSSFVRSGIAGEPFLERGLLPFNYAVSGGAFLYDYFALKRIAPVLAARADKPLLVLETPSFALQRQRGSAWSEYPQYLAIVRGRGEMLQHAPLLWQNFRDFGMTSPFISSVLLPSSIYRGHAVGLASGQAQNALRDHFYGAEDFSGYSPLMTRARPEMAVREAPLPPLARDEMYDGKVAFLRAFLTLARDLGIRVALYAAPSLAFGRDDARLDVLLADLQREFAGVRRIAPSETALDVDEFDEGGHPNIRGADKIAQRLVEALGLTGDRASLAAKVQRAYETAVLPPLSQWTINGRATPAGEMLVANTGSEEVIAESPRIAITPGREWALEVAVPRCAGRFQILMIWRDRETGQDLAASDVTPLDPSASGSSVRVFVRAAPNAEAVTIRVVDYNVATGQPPSAGELRMLRLWAVR